MKPIKTYQDLTQLPAKYLVITALLFAFVVSSLFLTSCTSSATSEPETAITEQADYAGKKILWVDSYHEGYEWSDGIKDGVQRVLENSGVDLEIVRMDTKRNIAEEFGQQAGVDAEAAIKAFNPDVVIACDDNAQKYLVEPYLKDTDLPVVFCGVNWDASPYGYPASNITGMIEIDLVREMLDLLTPYAAGDRIAYLTGDNNTARKLFGIYNDRFFDGQLQEAFVTDFDEFKSEYLRLQDEVDMLYFGNNAGITDWDDAAAEAFILENTKIPSGSSYTWMAPYTMIIVGNSADEQGEWSAKTALSILDGIPVSDIPFAENKESTLVLNLDIADKLDVVFTPSVLRYAEVYGE